MATEAVGAHPTGMHTCSSLTFAPAYVIKMYKSIHTTKQNLSLFQTLVHVILIYQISKVYIYA